MTSFIAWLTSAMPVSISGKSIHFIAPIDSNVGRFKLLPSAFLSLVKKGRSLEGLSLINIDYSKIKAHPKIIEFYNKL